jgi:hypothetical protein
MLASMGGGASTGVGLSATGVLGDILILRLFACDGSGGERAAPHRAVGRRVDRQHSGAGAGRGCLVGGRLVVTSRPGELVAFDPVPVLRHPPVAAA